ncbi:MAG: hypothetical protein LQ346_006703 [Caloplaca aetnensis]|nr:MAG: hypothetical protein LQ346_006703 [Caloplaca aetnensis]
MAESDSSAVSGRPQSTQSHEAETMPASEIPDMANSATETSIPVAESSSTALEVTQTSSSSGEQESVVPVQGSSEEGSSTDGGPVAPTPSTPDPTSATSMDPAQSGLASENASSKGSQSSANPDPTSFETHVSSSSSIPLTMDTSSQTQSEPLSNTNDPSPPPTDTGSVEPSSGDGVSGTGDIGSDSAMQPTESTEQASSSETLSHTGPEAQGTLSVNGETQTSASLTDLPDLPPSTKGPQVESPRRPTSSVSATEPSLSNGPSSVDSQLLLPTDETEPAGAGLFPTVAEASMNTPAGPSDTFIPSGEVTPGPILPSGEVTPGPILPSGQVTPGPILPEAPSSSQDAAILPPPSLEKPPKPSDTNSDVPTATWTTTPPDFKEVVVTNTEWTRDTLITTTSPGSDQPTVVPVFANCEGCGPGGSLVVFGVSIPLISYHLPKIPGFPPIPRFHLPCVLFCPSSDGPPPGSSSNHDNDKPPQPGPPEREEEKGDDDKNDDKNDDQEDDQQSTTSQSSSATSSTSSSTETSSSTGTGGPVVTETAYIDERPTGGFAGGDDMDMNQYLLAAYTSLGIADEQFDSAALSTVTAPTAMSITNFGDLVTASPLISSSTSAMPTTLSCASLTDPSGPRMERSDLLGPTSVDPYGARQTVGYLAEACGPLADDTAPLAGGPFAGDHSYSAAEPTQSQPVHAHFVVSNNASVCESTEPTVGDCKKWFGTIVNRCGVEERAGGGRITDADCTVYDLSIEGEE